MTTKQEAREQGAQANYDGLHLVHNPWLTEGDEYLRDAWEDGYQSVQDVRNFWEGENHQRAVMYAD